MDSRLTVEEAAALLHIEPPLDPALREDLVHIVAHFLAWEADGLKTTWRVCRETWRLRFDPECVYVDGVEPAEQASRPTLDRP